MNNQAYDYFFEFLKIADFKKQRRSDLLQKSAEIIFHTPDDELSKGEKNIKIKFVFLIAKEQVSLAYSLGVSKEFEFSPKIKIYEELAFKLMYKYRDYFCYREMLPFVNMQLKRDKSSELVDYVKKCLQSEEIFIENIKYQLTKYLIL